LFTFRAEIAAYHMLKKGCVQRRGKIYRRCRRWSEVSDWRRFDELRFPLTADVLATSGYAVAWMVATIMAALALQGAFLVIRQAVGELRVGHLADDA
jgi:hypothetical protein